MDLRPTADAQRSAYVSRALALIMAALAAGVAVAGGDYVKGRVSGFSGADGVYTFHFEQSDARPALEDGCPRFTVLVQYGRVPWYSWVPLVKTSHPTRGETDAAAAILAVAERERRLVSFGYTGNGLIPSGGQCTSATKGLRIIKDDSGDVLMAFYDPT
ncbi:MAG TPA: hypothetical protein VLE22_27190 [Bryobacteraceae bacterium]|nr:hypothetical protein [Bryobacteraceae bacterium]